MRILLVMRVDSSPTFWYSGSFLVNARRTNAKIKKATSSVLSTAMTRQTEDSSDQRAANSSTLKSARRLSSEPLLRQPHTTHQPKLQTTSVQNDMLCLGTIDRCAESIVIQLQYSPPVQSLADRRFAMCESKTLVNSCIENIHKTMLIPMSTSPATAVAPCPAVSRSQAPWALPAAQPVA